jgi:hypothetical protein
MNENDKLRFVGHSLEISRAGKQLPEHVRQNSTMLVIIDLDRGVDSQGYGHLVSLA